MGGLLKNWQEIFIFLYFSGFEIESIYISGAAATAAALWKRINARHALTLLNARVEIYIDIYII